MDAVANYLSYLLGGVLVTVEVTLLAIALSLVFGIVVGVAAATDQWTIRWLSIAYIEFWRGTSEIVQLFWAFFVLPLLFGVQLSAFLVAVVVLGLNKAAFVGEAVRGGIASVPSGQHDACVALNLRYFTTYGRVILPQATIAAIPPFANAAADLLKATSIVSLITVSDITFRAAVVRQATGQTVILYLGLLVVYLLLSLSIVGIIRTAGFFLRRRYGFRAPTALARGY